MNFFVSLTLENAFVINCLAENKSLREEMGKKAAERVAENFNEKDIIRKLYEYLSEGVDR